jgi:type I restriction enzyme M protein
MITQANFKHFLELLDFENNGDVYTYHFDASNCKLSVDFSKSILIYPEDTGLIVNERQTCNLSTNENFVVFECVYRLLKKGYKPQHLILEPKWQVGHGSSGGRADILVKDNNGKSFLIIECKTFGDEFERYWKKTLQDGDQLFSYARQETSTKYLCMYASDFIDGKAIYNSNIVTLIDNETYLKSLKEPVSYKDATDVPSLFKAWNLTYGKEYATRGIFEENIAAYEIGKNAYSIDDLTIVGNNDIQKKYHEFATILRQHNVSGRENAFDKLVNLFLAKIVDEIQHPTQLDFYWKGIAFDDYYSLQDRIQKLYKDGMEKFLREKVTYIDNNTINETFRLFKNDPDATKETILNYFRQLKFYTNNDFAFLDVHNEHLFYQNAEILLKIIKMLQDIRLKTDEPNQFLGDLFEGFLDQGVKQSEGQFFTPMPVVKFLVSSLPLETIIVNDKKLPKVIDYACGAGHFLNEYAAQIREFVDKENLKEHYANIYGIEKEYRLSKVAKVSAFMYGQDEINIVYADALDDNNLIEDGTFDILIANPPYSVKGFLETLSEEERQKYSIFSVIGKDGIITNNSIETFFVERASQLLAPNGIAAIILPSSILNNGNAVYVKAREIFLKNFDIVAIVEFGSGTFGKTGTNTVTMFLRKKDENPSLSDHYQNRVNSWFSNDFSKDDIFDDDYLLDEYCSYIDIDTDYYKTLLVGNPCEDIFDNELFAEYKSAFENSTDWKNRAKQKTYKNLSQERKDEEFQNRLIAYIRKIEKDKMYYFMLASSNPQPVVIVKAPSKTSEMKEFLGYEWSSAKGNEGIKYIGVSMDDVESTITKNKGINSIKTPLFNPSDLYDEEKINTSIRYNFMGRDFDSPHVKKCDLIDMIEFKAVTFDKVITLSNKEVKIMQSKYPLVKLSSIANISAGGDKPKIFSETKTISLSVPVFSNGTINNGLFGYTDTAKITKNCITISARGTIGYVVEHYEPFVPIIRLLVVIPDESKVLLKYLKEIFVCNPPMKTGAIQGQLTVPNTSKLLIPLPPFEVQNIIVKECEMVDEEYNRARTTIEEYHKKIEEQFDEIDRIAKNQGRHTTLSEAIVLLNSASLNPTLTPDKQYQYVDIQSIENGTGAIISKKQIVGKAAPSRARRLAPSGTTLISTVRPNLKGFTFIENELPDTIYSTGFATLKSADISRLLDKWIYLYFMYSKHMMEQMEAAMPRGQYPSINADDIRTLNMYIPSIQKQKEIITLIKEYEDVICTEKVKCEEYQKQKEQILAKYLN